MAKTFFTADWHLGHRNIIEACNRPFDDIQEMTNLIINNYNAVVGKRDVCYFLGDIVWCSERHFYSFLFKKLKGKKRIILGNHDRRIRYDHLLLDDVIQSIDMLKDISIDNNSITLCHYPLRSWNKSCHGSYHLHGHSHGTLEESPNSTDVGVDKWGFQPMEWQELKEYMDAKG